MWEYSDIRKLWLFIVYIWCIQVAVADSKTAETPDIINHQLDKTEEVSERQPSATCQNNDPAAQKTCVTKYSPTVLQCKHCYYTTTYAKALKTHSRKHTGSGTPGDRFQCQHCDYKTAHTGNFKAHSRKHTGDKFECQHCDYTTGYSSDLKVHYRKHTGDMLKCQDCDFSTPYSGLLKAHSRKHTGDMFQCQHCDYKTTRSAYLKAHLRKHTDVSVSTLWFYNCSF